MGRKTEVRSDLYTKEALLRLARTQKNNRASRRLLGIAHALGGMTISAAAQAAGMERQALGDAIKRYNAEGHCSTGRSQAARASSMRRKRRS